MARAQMDNRHRENRAGELKIVDDFSEIIDHGFSGLEGQHSPCIQTAPVISEKSPTTGFQAWKAGILSAGVRKAPVPVPPPTRIRPNGQILSMDGYTPRAERAQRPTLPLDVPCS